MKKNNQSLEVLEPEVEEIPLEQVINTALVKANVTDAVIASLKEKYGGMKLKSLEDKESYLDIKEARKEVRKIGILTEKLCKKGREDAIAIQKKWLAKEREILGKIDEVETPLNKEIERFDNEVERKELAEAKLIEETSINRQSALSKMGAIYDSGSFVLNHISYEIELIKQADNDMWNDTILPKYKKEFEANEAAKVEEENKRKVEMEAAKKQREEFEQQQMQFRIQQEEFAQQQRELQKMKDDAEREKKLEQENKEAEERRKAIELLNIRAGQLLQMGFTANHDSYYMEDVRVISIGQIIGMAETNWAAMIMEMKPIAEMQKNLKEAFWQSEIEEQAIQKERDRVAEENRQLELKKQQDEQRKQEELVKAGDKAQWQHFVSQLNAIQFPALKSGMYRSKLAQAKEKIEEINNL